LFGLGQSDDGGEVDHFCLGESAADDHAGAFDEAFGFEVVLGGGQGPQVAHGVGDHGGPDADLPVESGEGVDAVDDAAAGA